VDLAGSRLGDPEQAGDLAERHLVPVVQRDHPPLPGAEVVDLPDEGRQLFGASDPIGRVDCLGVGLCVGR
jgi:hypothetical protein